MIVRAGIPFEGVPCFSLSIFQEDSLLHQADEAAARKEDGVDMVAAMKGFAAAHMARSIAAAMSTKGRASAVQVSRRDAVPLCGEG